MSAVDLTDTQLKCQKAKKLFKERLSCRRCQEMILFPDDEPEPWPDVWKDIRHDLALGREFMGRSTECLMN